VDPGETPEELFAIMAVITGFLLLTAAVATSFHRAQIEEAGRRLEAAAADLLAAFLEDPALRHGTCLDAFALDATDGLGRLSPSRSFHLLVEPIRAGPPWSFGNGTVGDFRVALSAACVVRGDVVSAARVAVAVGS